MLLVAYCKLIISFLRVLIKVRYELNRTELTLCLCVPARTRHHLQRPSINEVLGTLEESERRGLWIFRSSLVWSGLAWSCRGKKKQEM